jgi:hypothetical protein
MYLTPYQPKNKMMKSNLGLPYYPVYYAAILCLSGTRAKYTRYQKKLNCLLKLGVGFKSRSYLQHFKQLIKKGEVNIIGIAEPNKILLDKYGRQFKLPDSLYF